MCLFFFLQQERFFSNLDPFVGFLAVNYLDRFISRQGMPVKILESFRRKRRVFVFLTVRFNWFGVAERKAMDLEAPLDLLPFSRCKDDEDFILSIWFPCEFLHIKDCSFLYIRSIVCLLWFGFWNLKQSEEGIIFDPVSITRMEFLILGGLKWRMRSITPFAFLDFFLSLFERNDPPLKEALKARATDIVFKSQNGKSPLQILLSHYQDPTVDQRFSLQISRSWIWSRRSWPPLHCSLLLTSFPPCNFHAFGLPFPLVNM